MFAENKDVVFGDVCLSEGGPRGNHNPGAGGWPTIKFFNKETGLEGKAYEKKTDMAMCEELGPNNDYMEAFVEEAGKTSLCGTDGSNCDERSLKYLEKAREQDESYWKSHMERLTKLEDENMKEDLKVWIKKRKKILGALLAEHHFKSEL